MAFPRRIKSETWFMRLPTGEIEMVSASGLEDAFRCGLADARTPVRAVGSAVWSTLADVAGIQTSDSRNLGSLLPVEVDNPAADLTSGPAWRGRAPLDTCLFERKPGRFGVRALAATAALAIAVAAFNQVLSLGERVEIQAAASANMTAFPSAAEAPHLAPEEQGVVRPEPTDRAAALAVERSVSGIDPRHVESSRHSHRRRGAHASGSTSATTGTNGANPFTSDGNPLDPLNGSL